MKATLMAVAVLGIMAAVPARAADGPHEDPDASGTVGLFTVPRAGGFARGEWSIGSFYETMAREEGSSNVERGGIFFGIGVLPRLELSTSIEPRMGVRRKFDVEDATGTPHLFAPRLNDHPFATEHFQHGFGDLRFGLKYKFLGDPDSYTGLAADATVKIPTSQKDRGIGTGKPDFGTDLIASAELGKTLGLNGNVGLLFRGDPSGIELAHELHWGTGLQVPTRFWLQGIVELYGVRYISKPDPSLIGFRNYAILQGGLRLSLANGIAVSAGINRNLSIKDRFGVEPEKTGSFVQVSFTMRPRMVPPPPPPPANRPPSLSCRAESSSVRRGESVRLYAETHDPDGDTVTVQWSASEGTVTPSSGTSVNWSSAGVRGGSVSITATASDGHGGTVTCVARVNVEEPPQPRAAVPTVRRSSCDEFAPRSARIDNRCKAVLDDVAVTLRSSPGARLRITGAGDSSADGKRSTSLAAERAQNASNYLVKTHGIDASRITVESGSEAGRRVDLELTIP